MSFDDRSENLNLCLLYKKSKGNKGTNEYYGR